MGYPASPESVDEVLKAVAAKEPRLVAVVSVSAHVYDDGKAICRHTRLDMVTRRIIAEALSEQAMLSTGRLALARVLHYAAQEHYVDQGGDSPLPW